MFDAFFILSKDGDLLIFKNHRGDIRQSLSEIFFEKVSCDENLHPIIKIDSNYFINVVSNDLHWVLISSKSNSGAIGIDIIHHIITLIKNMCGNVNEELVRMNFPVIYEIIDEVFEYGYPQTTEPDIISPFVVGKVISKRSQHTSKTSISSQENLFDNSLLKDKYGVYVDLIESFSCTNNNVANATIEGNITIKAISSKPLQILVSLNKNIRIKDKSDDKKVYDTLMVDDIIFHPSVITDKWDEDRTLKIELDNKEILLCKYNLSYGINMVPFKIKAEYHVTKKLFDTLTIHIACKIPYKYTASDVSIECALPNAVKRCSFKNINNGIINYENNIIVWKTQTMNSNDELTIVATIQIERETDDLAKYVKNIGPINVNFSFPTSLSSIFLRNIQILGNEDKDMTKWARSLTKSGQYTVDVEVINEK